MNQETGRRKQETSEEKVFRKQESLYERLVQLGASVQHLSNNLQRMAEMSARVNAAMLMLVGLPRHFAFGFRSMLFHGAAGSAGPFKGGYGNSGFLPRGVSQSAGFGGKTMTDAEYLKKYEEMEVKKKEIWNKVHGIKSAEEKEKERLASGNPNLANDPAHRKKNKKRNDVASTFMTEAEVSQWLNPGKHVVIDTETIGTTKGKDGNLIPGLPAQVAAIIRDEAGNVIDKYEQAIVWPDKEFTAEETKLTGYEYRKDKSGEKKLFKGGKEVEAVSPHEFLEEYKDFMKGAKGLKFHGYNTKFDMDVMGNFAREMGLNPSRAGRVDVHELAKKMLPGLEDKSLQSVFENLFKERPDVLRRFAKRKAKSGHDAMDDVAMTALVEDELLARLGKNFPGKGKSQGGLVETDWFPGKVEAKKVISKADPSSKSGFRSVMQFRTSPEEVLSVDSSGRIVSNIPAAAEPRQKADPNKHKFLNPETHVPLHARQFLGLDTAEALDKASFTAKGWRKHSKEFLRQYREETALGRATQGLADIFDKGKKSAGNFFLEQAKATKSPFWRQIFLAGRTAVLNPAAAIMALSEFAKKAALPTMYAGTAAGSLLSAASPDAYATLTGSVKMLAIAFGQHLIPLAATLSFHFQKWAVSLYEGDSVLTSFTTKLITVTAIGGLVVTVLGSLVTVLGYLASSVTALIPVIKMLGVSGSAAAAAFLLIGAAAVTTKGQIDERDKAKDLLEQARSGKVPPREKLQKAVTDILNDKNLTASEKEYALIKISESEGQNVDAWSKYRDSLEDEINANPARQVQAGLRQVIGSIPGYGPQFLKDVGNLGLMTTTRPGGTAGLLNSAGMRGLTPAQAQKEASEGLATATASHLFAKEVAKTMKLPSGVQEKILQNNIVKGSQALMAIQTIKGTPQYSSVEEAYKRVQVAALSEDPLTSLLNKWQIELGKLFAEQLAQQKDGNNILADILGAFFK